MQSITHLLLSEWNSCRSVLGLPNEAEGRRCHSYGVAECHAESAGSFSTRQIHDKYAIKPWQGPIPQKQSESYHMGNAGQDARVYAALGRKVQVNEVRMTHVGLADQNGLQYPKSGLLPITKHVATLTDQRTL